MIDLFRGLYDERKEFNDLLKSPATVTYPIIWITFNNSHELETIGRKSTATQLQQQQAN